MNAQMLKTSEALWRAREEFGCSEAVFAGYWDPASPVKAEAANCYASHWRREGAGLLVAVANLGETATAVPVRFDRTALAVSGALDAVDTLSGESLSVTEDTLTLPLESQRWALVRVHVRAAQP